MAGPLTPVAIVNRALASFGGGVLTTMEDVTPPGPACKLVYETTVAALLAEYPWSFTKDVVKLTPIAASLGDDGMLDAGWRFVHALPTNVLAPPEKYLSNPRLEHLPVMAFQVMQGRVYSNFEDIWAVVRQRLDEASWPPYFVDAAVACLAAELMPTISGNASQLSEYQAKAWGSPSEGRRGGKLGLAKSLDARNSGGQALALDALIADWRS